MNKKISVIDLFAGSGGLSEGFHRQGYNIVAYIEKDRYACETLLTRYIYWVLKKKGNKNIYYDYLKGSLNKEALYTYVN